ncbi:MAG: pyridoxal phosphate-dependent aminotransferase [bacterium]
MSISKRIGAISPSVTLAITAKAKQMKQEGIDVVGFGAGEPDFDTPDYIKKAAVKAIEDGFTKYTPASGTQELKEAVCRKLKKDNNLDYFPDQVLISCGAKHSLFNIIVTMCQEGDEVLLPSPYWVSYPEMVTASGAKTVVLETTRKTDFKVLPEQLKKAITPKTKLFILNSPSNPTGMVYTKDELLEISRILVEKGVYCVSDEIYEKIMYDKAEHISIASFSKEMKEKTIVVNGMSKAYSMTGWRIGYAAGPKDIIKAMGNLQSHSTSNPTSISQKAALAGLDGSDDFVNTMVSEFSRRRDYIVKRLNAMEGISCIKPRGAFYVFPDISGLIGKTFSGKSIKSPMELAQVLLAEARVAVVPGEAFGVDCNMRLSYATSMKNITKGLDRIEEFIKKV